MKNQSLPTSKNLETTPNRRTAVPRPETKTSVHRYERRKIREQLRHLDWALAGVD